MIIASASAVVPKIPVVFAIPVDFILFALTLLGVALFHHHTLRVALTGLVTIALYKIFFTGFKTSPGATGFLFSSRSGVGHPHQPALFADRLHALVAPFREKPRAGRAANFMPHDWKGAFLMLVMVWILSSSLDNIAAALIGGAMAHQLFRAKVHIGYLAAIGDWLFRYAFGLALAYGINRTRKNPFRPVPRIEPARPISRAP
jgi:hypothetical protein